MRAARRWILAAVFAGSLPSGCNALRKTKECSTDLECPRGTSCDVGGGFCRTGGPINIGYLAARTGVQADITEERRIAIDFGRWVVEQHDPSRKVLERGIVVRTEDDLGSVAEVPGATARILQHNLAALIGPGPSSEVLEAQKQTFPIDMLHLAPSGGAPTLGEAQPKGQRARFLFQMVIGVPGFAPSLALFLASPSCPAGAPNCRPATYDVCYDGIALVHGDDVLSQALKPALEDSLAKDCVTVTASLVVPNDKKASYADEINKLQAATANGKPTRCLFLGVQTDVAGEILRTLKAKEASSSRAAYTAFIGGPTLNADTFYDDAKSAAAGGTSLAEGFYGFDADGTPDRKELRDLESLWTQYLKESNLDLDTPLDSNRVSYAEAAIILQLAIELAGGVDDPVALRDALVDVTGHDDGDFLAGPGNIAATLSRIRAARDDGRRAGIDYQGSYSNLDFDETGFVRTGTMVWGAQNNKVLRLFPFSEEQVSALAAAPKGPRCAK